LIILSAILIGIIAVRYRAVKKIDEQKDKKLFENENFYAINETTATTKINFYIRRISLQISAGILLWAIPLLILLAVSQSHFDFWKQLSVFFTKAAFVTIGGAYAVLPYVAQVSVETFGWLSKMQMIDGLALGETTPGPLIMVLAFVGFMAGYNSFGSDIGAGTLGLGLTIYYTFLPSFLFIFIGAPLIERTQTNPFFKSVLSYTSAAVTGVILNLGVYFAKAVMFSTSSEIMWIPLAWAIITFTALLKFKVNLVLWIGISIIIGLINYFIHTF
ncbi:MAG: chromate transporter, partial [Saprospiraceae bacterium]